MKPELTQARLKELLHYDPETGVFTWRVTNSNVRPAGSRAGSIDNHGYCVIRIDRRIYKAHRLAFLYMIGAFPLADVDHINRDRSDNRWVNLRRATRAENSANVGPRRRNTSGYRGVTWDKQLGKWRAQGMIDGRSIYIGAFADLEVAAAEALSWRKKHYGGFAEA